jgi:hypothetical protein
VSAGSTMQHASTSLEVVNENGVFNQDRCLKT